MGGPSAEYDVSILTGLEVLRHLAPGKHRVRAVVVGPSRELYATDIDSEIPSHDELACPQTAAGFTGPIAAYASEPLWADCDVAFLALHGSFGEDGKIQGFLETIGVAYTGSGVFASSVAMNKVAAKLMMEQDGIRTPPYSLYGQDYPDATPEFLVERHGLPCFAKCPHSGSSRLMGRADSAESLTGLLEQLAAESDIVLVESAIEGPELSCPVMQYPDCTVKALPPVEIRPVASTFFDYEAKYAEGASQELVPAPQPAELIEQVQHNALRVHRLLGCEGITRTDMLCADDGIYTLEINTLPGLTPASLVPKSFEATGGSYEELLEILLSNAIAKKGRERT